MQPAALFSSPASLMALILTIMGLSSPEIHAADCNSNGTVDTAEAGYTDCNSNGTADFCETSLSPAGSRILFDATKAEMAGNADWVIDADVRNVGNVGGMMIAGSGNESNPQRIPTPAASGITSGTLETYWSGGISAWGVALVKRAISVETLPLSGHISFGEFSNVQDLANYTVFVACEPNIAYTAAEKTAILSFVYNGGGLFMVADHIISDRNGDGIDSLQVWNDLMQNNGVAFNPFGITFNADNITLDSTAVDTLPGNPLIVGAAGTVGRMLFHNGCTMTIDTAANPTVRAAIWADATKTNSNVIVAFARYGRGRVVALGDSSPADDGTGDPNDGLFFGWNEANGDHAKLIINASLFLASLPADCNTNGTIDACEPVGSDCDTDGRPDGCEVGALDCNTNGTFDLCEVDCNSNATPDGCESLLQDCNTNGTPDGCDAGDCDTNAIPDACQAGGQMARLLAADPHFVDIFGQSVAVSGNTAIIGAMQPSFGNGAAYVFVRTAAGWTQQAKLTAADGSFDDQFGNSVSISGDTAIVGAFLEDTGTMDRGAAYVFVRSGTTWTPQAKLLAADGMAADRFGQCVAVSGNTAIIGSYLDDVGTNAEQGSAYVYVRSGTLWSLQAKLTAADGGFNNWFGFSAALEGNVALVGAPQSVGKGAAYVFSRSGTTWSQQAKLLAADGVSSDFFGHAVALQADTALVGAQQDDFARGSAYAFVQSGSFWSQQAKLTAANGAPNKWFGYSVALYGDIACIGAPLDDHGTNSQQGSAHVFSRLNGVWSQRSTLVAGNGGASDNMGISVAIAQDTVVAGAPNANITQAYQGAAYVFDFATDCNTDGLPDACQSAALDCNTDGTLDLCQGGCNTNGTPDACELAGQDCNTDGTFDPCQGGCNTNGTPDACELAGQDCNSDSTLDVCTPSALDCNSNVTPDPCELTGQDCNTDGTFDPCQGGCNTNGSPDACELGGHDCNTDATLDACAPPALDCNSDQTPDVCDMAGHDCNTDGTHDSCQGGCNTNAVPDACESGGCNTNGVPDECEINALLARLVAPDGDFGDDFGNSVAISGDTAVVGAWYADGPSAFDAGAAYVFVRTGGQWTLEAKLTAADGLPYDLFGQSVAISGDTVLVGAVYGDAGVDNSQGAAYVFTRTAGTWSLQAKLTAADGLDYDNFGLSVALDGNAAVVGALFADSSSNYDTGAAYVFTRVGTVWSQQAKLLGSDVFEYDYFGQSVAIDDNTILVGAMLADTTANYDTGAVYVFTSVAGVWAQQAKLEDPLGAPYDYFGWSVGLSGNSAIVGVPYFDVTTNYDQGAASVFVRSGTQWSMDARLFAADGVEGDNFGLGVAILGDTAVVGAPYSRVAPLYAQGAAYVFTRSGGGWTQTARLDAPNAGNDDDELGFSVALDGETAVAGATFDDVGTNYDQGSACIFGIARDCNQSGVPDLCEANALTDADSDGTLDACEPCPTCGGDVNGDDRVDGLDVASWARCTLGVPLPTDSCACTSGLTPAQFVDKLLHMSNSVCP